MGQIKMGIYPPKYWQDFEELTVDVFKFVFGDPLPTAHGRSGQSQQGVDVYGYDETSDPPRCIGIQCKKRDQVSASGKVLAGGLLTERIISDEVKKAKRFYPHLDRLIIATTALRDAQVQRFAREIDQDQRANNSFGLSIWFWEDYEKYIQDYTPLMYRYYEMVLKSQNLYDRDRHLLSLLHIAFSRPAFNTPLYDENSGADFLEAIADTQKAIRLGRLRDREENRILEVAPYGVDRVSRPQWREPLLRVCELLQDVRDLYTRASKQGLIEQEYRTLFVHDREVERQLNTLRAQAIEQLNRALEDAGIEPVRSRLLQMEREDTWD